jgi:hypothetical protein
MHRWPWQQVFENPSGRKLKYGKFGLAEDPRGLVVSLSHRGAQLVGEVTGAYYDAVTHGIRLKVSFSNGEPWPFDPSAIAVTVVS